MTLEDGTPVRSEQRLTIGTTSFLAAGGDGYTLLQKGELGSTGWIDVDALVEYLRQRDDPVPVPDVGRWQVSG